MWLFSWGGGGCSRALRGKNRRDTRKSATRSDSLFHFLKILTLHPTKILPPKPPLRIYPEPVSSVPDMQQPSLPFKPISSFPSLCFNCYHHHHHNNNCLQERGTDVPVVKIEGKCLTNKERNKNTKRGGDIYLK